MKTPKTLSKLSDLYRSPTMYIHIPTGKDKIFLPDMQITGIPGTLFSDGIDSAFSIHVLDKMDKNKLRKVETEHRQS